MVKKRLINSKGAWVPSTWWHWILTVLAILIGLVVIFNIFFGAIPGVGSWINDFRVDYCKNLNAKEAFSFWNKNIIGCDRIATTGFIDKYLSNPVRNFLGFDKSAFWDFLPDLYIGLLAGLLLRIIYMLAFMEVNFFKSRHGGTTTDWRKHLYANTTYKLEESWLAFLGSASFKILVIGFVYAVLMQIPFVNTFLDIITLNFLFSDRTIVVRTFFKAALIAFYFGFLPAIVEAIYRYKTVQKYREALVRAKYERKILRGMVEND